MSLHPLIALVSDRDVKQAKGFRTAAERLTGASLEADYQTEVANAPKRSAEGLAHLGVRVGRKAKGRQHGRDEKHLAEAIARAARSSDEDDHGTKSLELPTGESITLIDSAVPIKTAAPDKEKGASDPNAGIEDLPILAMIGDDRVAVAVLKYLEPDECEELTTELEARRKVSTAFIEEIQDKLAVVLAQQGIQAEITGRQKTIFSI